MAWKTSRFRILIRSLVLTFLIQACGRQSTLEGSKVEAAPATLTPTQGILLKPPSRPIAGQSGPTRDMVPADPLRRAFEIPAPELGGDIRVETRALPEDFPEDVPLPEGGLLGTYLRIPGKGPIVLFTVDQPPETAAKTYQEALEQQGWVPGPQERPSADQLYVTSYQKDERPLKVEVQRAANGCNITLALPAPTRE